MHVDSMWSVYLLSFLGFLLFLRILYLFDEES